MGYLKDLVSSWRTQFDSRTQEKVIKSFSNYQTYIDGLGIHFIHEHGKGPDPLPIIITLDYLQERAEDLVVPTHKA
jgi:microsomal epoxide hydrolase